MKIVALAAFSLETAAIVRHFSLHRSKSSGFVNMWTGPRFSLAMTGIGKVNAAAATQYIIDREKPDMLINAGLCGGFAKAVTIGDIVLPSHVVQHDNDQRVFGLALGHIPGIKKVRIPLFQLPQQKRKYTTGVCLTGDRILQGEHEASAMYTQFHPVVADMELGAIAQVCYLNKIKLLSIKSVTDIVEHSDITQFEKRAQSGMKQICKVLDETLGYLRAT